MLGPHLAQCPGLVAAAREGIGGRVTPSPRTSGLPRVAAAGGVRLGLFDRGGALLGLLLGGGLSGALLRLLLGGGLLRLLLGGGLSGALLRLLLGSALLLLRCTLISLLHALRGCLGMRRWCLRDRRSGRDMPRRRRISRSRLHRLGNRGLSRSSFRGSKM